MCDDSHYNEDSQVYVAITIITSYLHVATTVKCELWILVFYCMYVALLELRILYVYKYVYI